MRKAIIVIAAMLGFAFMSSAQPKAIGGRLGYGLEASYQHYLGSPNFLEANAGIWEQELLTQIKNTTAYTIKVSNRKKAVEEIVFGQRDLNQFGQIRWYITDKLEEENIDNETIDELSNIILNNIDEIIEILCTNYNKQNIVEFINNI